MSTDEIVKIQTEIYHNVEFVSQNTLKIKNFGIKIIIQRIRSDLDTGMIGVTYHL